MSGRGWLIVLYVADTLSVLCGLFCLLSCLGKPGPGIGGLLLVDTKWMFVCAGIPVQIVLYAITAGSVKQALRHLELGERETIVCKYIPVFFLIITLMFAIPS